MTYGKPTQMLTRVLEIEAMDTLDEALGYDSMDHAEVNRVFVDDLLEAGLPAGPILDLGTGTAQIPIELCGRRLPDDVARDILAIDMARHMLDLAMDNVRRARLTDRVRLQRIDAKQLPSAADSFAAVISNSIVHHIPNPSDVLAEAWRVLAPGGLMFVRDLLRPHDDRTVRHLVGAHASGATRHQRQMFDDSLRAALTVDELRALIAPFCPDASTVRATTDRHWTWVARKCSA